MPKLMPWRWWVGSVESVSGEGIYDVDECATRMAAIAAGVRALQGEPFYIVEARLWERNNPTDDGYEGFARERNKQLIPACDRERVAAIVAHFAPLSDHCTGWKAKIYNAAWFAAETALRSTTSAADQ